LRAIFSATGPRTITGRRKAPVVEIESKSLTVGRKAMDDGAAEGLPIGRAEHGN
jgi:hypothetical protein